MGNDNERQHPMRREIERLEARLHNAKLQLGRLSAFVKPGAPVWYEAGPEARFAAVVDGKPWDSGNGDWLVRLRELGEDYQKYNLQKRTTVSAAATWALTPREVPTAMVDPALNPSWRKRASMEPGQEANELRNGIERVMAALPTTQTGDLCRAELMTLLDQVDARDSVQYLQQTATRFDRFCQEAGIQPNTPESKLSYKAWKAARDEFNLSNGIRPLTDDERRQATALVTPPVTKTWVGEGDAIGVTVKASGFPPGELEGGPTLGGEDLHPDTEARWAAEANSDGSITHFKTVSTQIDHLVHTKPGQTFEIVTRSPIRFVDNRTNRTIVVAIHDGRVTLNAIELTTEIKPHVDHVWNVAPGQIRLLNPTSVENLTPYPITFTHHEGRIAISKVNVSDDDKDPSAVAYEIVRKQFPNGGEEARSAFYTVLGAERERRERKERLSLGNLVDDAWQVIGQIPLESLTPELAELAKSWCIRYRNAASPPKVEKPKHRLKLARERAGLSLGQAAKLLGWAKQDLDNLEGNPNVASEFAWQGFVRELAKLYQVNVPWLLGETPMCDYSAFEGVKGYDDLTPHDRDVIAEFAAAMPRNDKTTQERLDAVRAKKQPRWAMPGLSAAEVRDAIIAEVGMMASARTPEMQAAYDGALAREYPYKKED